MSARAAASDRQPWARAGYRRWFLAVLVTAYMVNYMDRQLLSILMEPIKADLLLADWQLGALGGIAFALFYTTLGLPIARLADRHSRVNIIALALAAWSIATALCGAAANFVQLMLARIGVAVGESAATPPSYSLISDLYAPNERAGATGLLLVGPPLGIALGLLLGGWIGDAMGWRAAFVIVGLPGLLLALVVRFTLREPPRGFAEGRVNVAGEASTVSGVLRLLSSRRSFWAGAVAGGVASFGGVALQLWLPSYLMRTFGYTLPQAGATVAAVAALSGVAGTVIGGRIADYWASRNRRGWMLVPCVTMLLAAPCAVVAFTAGTVALAIGAVALVLVLFHMWPAPIYTAAQGMVGIRMRAVTAALLLFTTNIIGLGLGPPLVGLVSDLLHARAAEHSLRLALLCTAPVYLAAAGLFYLASRSVLRDLERAPD
ncbi:MAG: spinster family MFS transporter [Gammaproteobacteria bacterium]